jgi:hypothetical protein
MGVRGVGRARLAGAVAVSLLGLGVAVAGQGTASGATAEPDASMRDGARASSVPASVAMTRLTFRSASCEGCRITAMRYLFSSTGQMLSARDIGTATMRSGVAVIRVPTAQTRGMAFQVETRDGRGSGGAVPVAVLRYRGQPVGSAVTKSEALSSTRGSWCWAGTTSSRKTIVLRTHRFTDPRLPAVYADSISVWSRTTLPVMRSSWSPLFRGGLGHQDAPWCP